MSKIFQDRFSEVMAAHNKQKVHIYPITLIHVSDLEKMEVLTLNRPNQIWELLRIMLEIPKFMPPFYNSLNRKKLDQLFKSF